MSKWPADWHPETVADAQKYLDAHENGAGDPDLIEECERAVETSKHRSGITTFPKPPDDQLEEDGAD
jgi:hypothetical protein